MALSPVRLYHGEMDDATDLESWVRVGYPTILINKPSNPLTGTATATPTGQLLPGAGVTITFTASGGVAPYSHVITKSTNTPTLSGTAITGASITRSFTVPSAAADNTIYTLTDVITDSNNTSITVSRTETVNVVTSGGKVPVGLHLGRPSYGLRSSNPDFVGEFNRVSRVGTTGSNYSRANKITAKRIFVSGDPGADGKNGSTDIEDAVAEGMLPVVSYVMPTYNAADQSKITNCANYLNSLGVPIAVLIDHEPYHKNIAAADFVAVNKAWMPLLKKPNLARGMLNNGFLMDNKMSTFDSYMPDELMQGDYWDWVGMDTYQAGVVGDHPWPGERIPVFRKHLQDRGYGTYYMGIGEWNAHEDDGTQAAYDTMYTFGTTFFADPYPYFACLWDSTATGDALLNASELQGVQDSIDDMNWWSRTFPLPLPLT